MRRFWTDPGKRMRTPHQYEVKNTLIQVVSAAAFTVVKIVQIFSVATTLLICSATLLAALIQIY